MSESDNKGRLLTVKEAAEYLSVSWELLSQWRHRTNITGKLQGPAFIKVGYQVRYDTDDLDAFIQKNKISE